jgi:hypothetical protein
MAATMELNRVGQSATPRAWEPLDLPKGFGGLEVLEHLMTLFGDSPKEFFSRIDVLAVLDAEKQGRLIPPKVKPGRIHAGRRLRPQVPQFN